MKMLRWILRGLLLVLVVAGVAYLVESLIGQQEPAFSGQEETAGGPPESVTVTPTTEGSAGASVAPAAEPLGEEGASVMRRFELRLIDDEDKNERAVITGEKAVKRGKNEADEVYDIDQALIVSEMLSGGESTDEGATLRKLRISALKALYRIADSEVQLYEDVQASSEGLTIATERVKFIGSKRMLVSESPLVMQAHRVDASGQKVLAMEVTGTAFEVDLALKMMMIERDVRTTMFNVSDDFLAGGLSAAVSEKTSSDLIITCSGHLSYDHMDRRIVFADNVKAVLGGRSLLCDNLAVTLARSENGNGLGVTGIVAAGAVTFQYEEQVATGDRMEWGSITQECVLTGEDAKLQTPDFKMRGATLKFFRLNSRFTCEGPGRLDWTAPEKTDATETDAEASAPEQGASAPLFALSMEDAKNLAFSWEEEMKYNTMAGTVQFRGAVKVAQNSQSLRADVLHAGLSEDGQGLDFLTAQGGVVLRQESPDRVTEASCQTLNWEKTRPQIDLVGGEQQPVRISSPPHWLESNRVLLNQKTGALECPEAGELKMTSGTGDGQGDAPESVAVRWQERMRYSGDGEPTAYFRGGVQATRTGQTVSCNELDVSFDVDQNPAKIVARGDVVVEIQSGGTEIPGLLGVNGNASEQDDSADPSDGSAGADGGLWRVQSDILEWLTGTDYMSCPAPGVLTLIKAGKEDSSITWKTKMVVDSENSFVYFEGDVEAGFGGATLQSGELRLDFDRQKRLSHIYAEANVNFRTGANQGWAVTSDSAEAVFVSDGILKQVVARGQVQVEDEQLTLACDQLQLFLELPEGARQPLMTRAVAEGHVQVDFAGKETVQARGDRLEYRRATGVYELTGDPFAWAKRGNVEGKVEKVLYNAKTGALMSPKGKRPATMTVE